MAEYAVNNAEAKKSKGGFVKYFRDLKGEFKKIVWPSKKQVINNTIIVIVAVIIIGLLIWLMDYALGWLVKLFIGA